MHTSVPVATADASIWQSMMYCPDTLTALTTLSDTRLKNAMSIRFTVERRMLSSRMG